MNLIDDEDERQGQILYIYFYYYLLKTQMHESAFVLRQWDQFQNRMLLLLV